MDFKSIWKRDRNVCHSNAPFRNAGIFCSELLESNGKNHRCYVDDLKNRARRKLLLLNDIPDRLD